MCWGSSKNEFGADALPPSRPHAKATSGQTPPGLQGHSPNPGDALITFQSCRYCSDKFTYICENGRRIHVIAGPPKSLESKQKVPPAASKGYAYKAISYVWGETSRLPMHCVQCKANFSAPLENVQKFQNITSLVSNDESIWLDTMSINQDDPDDAARQIAKMGQLYGDAAMVSVLLPSSDERGFQLLASLCAKAEFINQNQVAFSQNADPFPDNKLTTTCNEFYTLIEDFQREFASWKYWSRAWTFQEWAMASSIDVGLEGSPSILRNVKYSILQAATLMSVYKFDQGQYAEIRLNFPRGEVTNRLNAVKRIFPDERAFISADEAVEDKNEYLQQTLMTSLAFDKLLGLRTSRPPALPMLGQDRVPLHELFDLRGPRPSALPTAFKTRLSTMLNAFAISKREATFKGDLVACWASMCNIPFPYNRADSYGVALQKVLTAIREMPNTDGLRLFTWQANTNSQIGGVDLDFLEYACPHSQRNARYAAEFYGTPILTGRADTLRHMEVSLRQPATQLQLPGASTLIHALIATKLSLQAAQMNFIEPTLKLFEPVVSGISDGFMVHDIVPMMRALLERTPVEVLRSKALVVVTIETTAIDTGEPRRAALWTIIPYDRNYSDMMVARECVNGQLVLVVRRGDDRCDIVGYFAFTDQMCGTYLAWCGVDGRWLTRMDYPQRSDIVVSGLVGSEIWWGGKYELADEVKRLW